MKKLPFMLLCSFAMLMSACAVQSTSESNNPSAAQSAPKSIIGSWTVRAFDSLVLTEDNVSYPVMEFCEEGRVNATAGCNTLSGEYTYAEASLTFSDKLCQTLMFCPEEEIARNEQLLAQAMDSVLTVTSCGSDSIRLQGKHSMLLVKTNAVH